MFENKLNEFLKKENCQMKTINTIYSYDVSIGIIYMKIELNYVFNSVNYLFSKDGLFEYKDAKAIEEHIFKIIQADINKIKEKND